MNISITIYKHKIDPEKEQLIQKLIKAFVELEKLQSLIPIYAEYKKMKSDDGYWKDVDKYPAEHTQSNPSHSICPDCMKKLYPEIDTSDPKWN
ncbi:MAG TPA: hypothetical protein QF468_12975 [Nitrospinota bacterium]|jgi:hypothetical protein|nr:hypothetical protein [Nitrospinota bacterium]|tara:strand:+ start:553 stop:831 length:279 start_codon:yes stop_codon:yes gene_type:complete